MSLIIQPDREWTVNPVPIPPGMRAYLDRLYVANRRRHALRLEVGEQVDREAWVRPQDRGVMGRPGWPTPYFPQSEAVSEWDRDVAHQRIDQAPTVDGVCEGHGLTIDELLGDIDLALDGWKEAKGELGV